MIALLVGSAIYLLLIGLIYRTNGSRLALSFVLTVAGFCLVTPILLLMGGACSLWFLVCSVGNIPNRAALAGVLLVVGGALTWEMGRVYQVIAKVEKGRQQYPLVSLVDRLAYEGKVNLTNDDPLKNYDETKSVHQADEEYDDRAYMRTRALRILHERSNFAFVAADGFGVYRMPSVEREPLFYLKQEPSSEPIPQPETEENFDLATPDGGWKREPRIFEQETLRTAHAANTQAFANPRGFGFVKSLDQVAGFQPHGLFKSPNVTWWDSRPPTPADDKLPGLQLLRLELVSMLKFDTPQVYISAHLPTMEHPDDFKTRPLDDFEAPAMARLQAGEDIVQAKYRGHLRMLGALRAGKNCLECHRVPQNTLLGAFTYRFRTDLSDPEPNTPKPEPTTF